MKKLTQGTLVNLTDQLASHSWRSEEIQELVDPKLGIITGFQDLLNELDELRRTDLGFIAPALGVHKRCYRK